MDALTINQQTNLVDLVGGLKRNGRYHVGPCPFCGGRDRFNVKEADGVQLWICRQCGDGRYQDAVSFLMKRDGLTFREVVGDGGQTAAPTPTARAARRPSGLAQRPLAQPPGEAWQLAALTAVRECCANLFGLEWPVWGWLEKRGITADVTFAASLGFNPAWRQVGPDAWLAPGVTIPALIAGELWYVQVRTTEAARQESARKGRRLDKYHALTGSRLKALYGADKLLAAHTAVITEGEFDALLVGRYLPPGWAAVTMGSAGSLPDNAAWLRYFAGVRRAYLVMDNDQAGETAVGRWRELLNWVELLPVPAGHKDVTEFWQAGGDVAGWVCGD